ncbi:MAG: hypothetical protein P1S46_10885 [bacterium]|nr:hypothetical protein [bacterium]
MAIPSSTRMTVRKREFSGNDQGEERTKGLCALVTDLHTSPRDGENDDVQIPVFSQGLSELYARIRAVAEHGIPLQPGRENRSGRLLFSV